MGFGVFVMLRKQLLGIKERAEAHPLCVEGAGGSRGLTQ